MIAALVWSTASLAAAGGWPAWRIARTPLAAALLAPPLGAVVLALAGVVAVLSPLSPTPAAIGCSVIAAVAGHVLTRPGCQRLAVPTAVTVVAMVVLAIPMAVVLRPPVDWDAQAIWMHHARWFADGGEHAREAFGDPVRAFSHADYPPLLPAAGGTVAAFRGPYDDRTPQAVAAVLTWCGLVWLVALVSRTFRGVLPGLVAGLIAASLLLAKASHRVANGEADVLWSVALVVAVVGLVAAPRRVRWGTVAVTWLTIAGLTKNDALPLVVTVALAAMAWRELAPAVRRGAFVALAATASWLAVSRALGTTSDLLPPGHAGRVMRGELPVAERWAASAASVGSEVALVAASALALTACWAVSGTGAGRAVRHLLLALWAAAGIGALALVTVYAVGPHDLDFWLPTSVERTTDHLVALLAVIIGVAGVQAVAGPHRSATPADGKVRR